MTISGTDEGVLGPFWVIGQFLQHAVLVESLLLYRVDADCPGDAFDASFGDAVVGADRSFGKGFVLFIFRVLVIFVSGVVGYFYRFVPVFGVKARFFNLRHDFLTLSDWIDARAADSVEVLLIGHFGDQLRGVVRILVYQGIVVDVV